VRKLFSETFAPQAFSLIGLLCARTQDALSEWQRYSYMRIDDVGDSVTLCRMLNFSSLSEAMIKVHAVNVLKHYTEEWQGTTGSGSCGGA
jgi:hypothetical protein